MKQRENIQKLAINYRSSLLWDVTRRRFVAGYRRSGTTYRKYEITQFIQLYSSETNR